jgi:transposase-like protein
VSEAKAKAIIDHLDEGCSIRSTSWLTKVAKETMVRLLKTSSRHAQRFHDQEDDARNPLSQKIWLT